MPPVQRLLELLLLLFFLLLLLLLLMLLPEALFIAHVGHEGREPAKLRRHPRAVLRLPLVPVLAGALDVDIDA